MSIFRLMIPLAVIAMQATMADGLAFQAPLELTQATELNEFIMIDADGNGTLDATGYDAIRGELVACLRRNEFVDAETRLVIGKTENYDV